MIDEHAVELAAYARRLMPRSNDEQTNLLFKMLRRGDYPYPVAKTEIEVSAMAVAFIDVPGIKAAIDAQLAPPVAKVNAAEAKRRREAEAIAYEERRRQNEAARTNTHASIGEANAWHDADPQRAVDLWREMQEHSPKVVQMFIGKTPATSFVLRCLLFQKFTSKREAVTA